MPDYNDADVLAHARAEHEARAAETPAQRQARQAAADRERAQANCAEAGIPFDRYAFDHKRWRDLLADAGQKVLRQDATYRGHGRAGLPTPAERLLVGPVWIDGPWRRFSLGSRDEWLSDTGVVVRPADVQAVQLARVGPGPDAEAWAAYARLLADEPAPDCDGAGITLNPDDVEDRRMIETGDGWCVECERTVPVIHPEKPSGGFPELAPHDTKGRPITTG